jgi:uncharacterized membrane protein HdeD (DUF308 family)
MTNNQWLTFLINGIIALVFGVFALAVPEKTVILLAKYLGLLILIGGVILVIIALTRQTKDTPYTSLLVQGILGTVLGAAIFFFTSQSITLFLILLGVWGIVFGLVQLIVATRLKAFPDERTLIIINGLLTLVFGVLLFFNPFEAAVAFTFIVGLIAIIIGVGFFYFAFKLRKVSSESDEES